MTSKQKLALGLVGAAAVAMLFCALTKQWFKIEGRGFITKVGLLEVESCMTVMGSETCKSESLAESLKEAREHDDNVDTWLMASKFTFYLALASVLILIGVGVLGFMHHEKVAVVGKIALLVLILTILGSVVLLAKRPILLNASLGVFLFMFGGMAGVIGAQMLTNENTYIEIERDPSIPKL